MTNEDYATINEKLAPRRLRNSLIEWVCSCFGPAPELPAQEMAALELENARRDLLAAQSQFDHARAMVECHRRRIERLEGWK